MGEESFFRHISYAAGILKRTDAKETIRVVSHFDADGICAASLVLNALTKERRHYSLSIIKQLTEQTILDLAAEEYKIIIFSDLGAGQLPLIKKHLTDRTIFILDHHSFDLSEKEGLKENIIMVNPHCHEIDGAYDISGAGVCYFFGVALDETNKDKSYIALIGALGDIQEKEGFAGLNCKILESAIKEKQITVEKGLKWFGIETKSLIYLLTYNTDLYIPEITGSESKAIEFLVSLGIDPKAKNRWKTFNELTDTEKAMLISGIVMKRSTEANPEDILGDRYLLLKEPLSSPFRDLKEFSTTLNACGRMNRPSIGIGVCLDDEQSKKKALDTLSDYKKEIVFALRWYSENQGSENIRKTEDYIIINAKDKIMPSVIGTLASIISNSGELKQGTLILSLARDEGKVTKASLRIKGKPEGIDLREIINSITEKSAGQSGGHKNAAGAILPTDKEEMFLKVAEEEFKKIIAP